MHVLRIERPHSINVTETDTPAPGVGELLIRVAACGICGTDLHIYEGSYMGEYPVIPGHEFSGTVIATGKGVHRFSVDDRVAVEPNLPCNNCEACLNNRQNFCENWQAIGVTLPGAMAEFVVVPESAAFAIGALSFEEATFVEPLSCVLHGLEKLRIEPGARAAIIGAGPIGMLLMRALFARGVTRLAVAERNAGRREFAAEAIAMNRAARTVAAPDADARNTVSDAGDLEPDAYDIVVDATGAPGAMAQALELVRPGGEALWFGVPNRDARIEFAPFLIFQKGLSIHGSFTSVRNSIQAVEMLASGTIEVADLVTNRVTLDGVEDAFSMLGGGASEARKVLVVPGS